MKTLWSTGIIACGWLALAATTSQRVVADDPPKLQDDKEAVVGKWVNAEGGAKDKGVSIEVRFFKSGTIGFTESKDSDASSIGFHQKFQYELAESDGKRSIVVKLDFCKVGFT